MKLLFSVVLFLAVSATHAQEPFKGITYAGYRSGQSPYTGVSPSPTEVQEDMTLVRSIAPRVRTYSARERVNVPEVAAASGLEVFAGAWVSDDRESTEQELAAVVAQAKLPAVTHVIVGNEALLRKDVSVGRMALLLEQTRGRTDKPVSTAEPWGVWLAHPELAKHVDFIAAHILPYWEDVPATKAVEYAMERLTILQEAFPGKRIVITETGWPSDGEKRGRSIASLEAQRNYLTQFAAAARARNIDYFIIEGFDQPWKHVLEGKVGSHWGVFDANRRLKL